MRSLTFTGFLKTYVRSLSMSDTNSIYELAQEAAGKNPRLREPLLLYAVFSDKTDVLLRATKAYELYSEYNELTSRYDKAGFEAALQDDSSPLSAEYRKVWRTFISNKNRHQSDNNTKELMRTKVVKLQNIKGVSNYRLYADLRLNPGNFNSWLKYGDPNKVSLNTARRALQYLENVPRSGSKAESPML